MESLSLERAADQAKLESETAARKATETVAKEVIEKNSEPALQQKPRVQRQQVGHGYSSHSGTHRFVSQNGMRVPKFIDGLNLHLWSSRFQTFLTARGLIVTIEPTCNPILVAGGSGGMAVRDRLIPRYGQEKVEKCEKAWDFLMEAM